MNDYQARQLKESGKWHFTCENDGKIWPVGYCADHAPHDSKEEAEACYVKFLLETKLRFETVLNENLQFKCKECGEWTQGGATVDGTHVPLCINHRNLEFVKRHWIAPVVNISSY